MYKLLTAILLLLLAAGGTKARHIEAREVQKETGAGQDKDTSIHPFLLNMQKCLGDGYSVLRCCGVVADEVRTIVGHIEGKATNLSGDEVRIRFNITTATEEAKIQYAQLLVHTGSFSKSGIVGHSECAKNGVTLQLQVVDSKIKSQSLSWNLTLSISDLVGESWIRLELGNQKWLQFNEKVLTIAITMSCNASLSQILSPMSKAFQPHLVLYRKSSSSERANAISVGRHQVKQTVDRRAATIAFATSDACGLHKYEVNVSVVFGNSVLYPRTYEANYCDGICEDPGNSTSLYQTSHARVQYYLSVSQPSLPAPKCAVSSYAAVALIFSEDNSIVLRVLNDLSASGCQCL